MRAPFKYETIAFQGTEASEAAIVRNLPQELLHIPLAAGLSSDDLPWAQSVCARLAVHLDANVRGNALLGFAHLARRFGHLDRALVEPLVRSGLADPDVYVRGHAENAVDDLRHFLGWQVEPAT